MTTAAAPPPAARAEESRLLLVEDDLVIRNTVRMLLERYGFTVFTAADGLTGLEMFHAEQPDLLLLDVMLPELDGIGLCRRIREFSLAPILMMSARSDALDIVSGLEAGADDYVVKPVQSAVLVARIRSLLRRVAFAHAGAAAAGAAAAGAAAAGAVGGGTGGAGAAVGEVTGGQAPRGGAGSRGPGAPVGSADGPGGDVLVFGELAIDTAGLEVRRAGETVALTPTELRLLLEFAAAPGVVLERRALLDRVWDHAWHGDTRVVDLHVQRLRAKIGAERIETVRGFGYKLRRQ